MRRKSEQRLGGQRSDLGPILSPSGLFQSFHICVIRFETRSAAPAWTSWNAADNFR